MPLRTDGDATPRGGRPATAAVVICSRDRPEMLERALAAVQRGVPDDTEIIVVDSASRDDRTRAVAERAGVRYLRSDIPGLSIARNIGLRATECDVVAYTDDDCEVAPDFLAELVVPFADPQVHAATGRLRDAHSAPSTPVTEEATTLTRILDGLDAGHGALMAVRRGPAVTAGGFDPILGAGRRFGGAEDMDMLCRLLRSGGTVARVPRSIVTHVFTREDDDYVRLNTNYGLGLGAMCAKWRRMDPAAGRSLTFRVARRGISRLVRRSRDTRTRTGQLAFLRGLARGFSEARRIPLDGQNFRDERPPAPVSAESEGIIG
ncbi:glycosyltransferase family 2 protein [Microbacterium aurantiacum]|uniref:Glycosyltransferase family 2 protein n=1 Tax=Microbacterium aurantiacum TaxID=162393 RepID=A0AAJ2LUJ4_9MICO|nr:glycosyltransferase family A protein [Microbacterium aurantiacum]MDS0244210.1 glycosyltransferase family 2 protein [Microbacterium aurantiacum]